MTTRLIALTTLFVTAAAGAALAQPQAPPTATPRILTPPAVGPVAPSPERPRREGQALNIKVDLTLTDQRGTTPAVKRTLTVLAADGYTGSIRTQSNVIGTTAPVPLNVDASPTLLADGKIRLAINLQYDWPAPADGSNIPRGTVMSTSLHDQLMLILENGKAMVVAQSADPVGDRQVMVEVKATILK